MPWPPGSLKNEVVAGDEVFLDVTQDKESLTLEKTS